jgi:predicted O-methyltransferase YrrM
VKSNVVVFIIITTLFITTAVCSQTSDKQKTIDNRVKAFLKKNKGNWRDMNVPEADGQVLHDIIVKNNYKSCLEIGSSTGHSGVWIAWALSKTGGKLITIEIDERRHRIALANFKEAGLSEYIDARLADAHKLVRELAGPFDFVFSDADKEWYINYFKDVAPKVKVGGCFTAHNVTNKWTAIEEFLDFLKTQTNFETTIDTSSRSGISISYKKYEN